MADRNVFTRKMYLMHEDISSYEGDALTRAGLRDALQTSCIAAEHRPTEAAKRPSLDHNDFLNVLDTLQKTSDNPDAFYREVFKAALDELDPSEGKLSLIVGRLPGKVGLKGHLLLKALLPEMEKEPAANLKKPATPRSENDPGLIM